MKFRLVETPIRSDYRYTLISIIMFTALVNKEFETAYKTLIDSADDKNNIEVHHIRDGYIQLDDKHKKPVNQNIENIALLIKGKKHPQTLEVDTLSPDEGITLIKLFSYLAKSKDEIERYQEELKEVAERVE